MAQLFFGFDSHAVVGGILQVELQRLPEKRLCIVKPGAILHGQAQIEDRVRYLARRQVVVLRFFDGLFEQLYVLFRSHPIHFAVHRVESFGGDPYGRRDPRTARKLQGVRSQQLPLIMLPLPESYVPQ